MYASISDLHAKHQGLWIKQPDVRSRPLEWKYSCIPGVKLMRHPDVNTLLKR